MKTEHFGDRKIIFYDSIDTLPIHRFFLFNLNLLIDSGIGSDLSDIDSNLGTIAQYVAKGETQKALAKLENLRTAFYFTIEQINPKGRAFVCLIKEINGEPLNDLSDENIQRIVLRLGKMGASKSFIYTMVEKLKKKLSSELELFFPEDFGLDGKQKEFFEDLLNRTKCLLRWIISKDQKELEKIEQIDSILFAMAKPSSFSGSGGVEAVYIMQYEETNILMAETFHLNPKEKTALEYYTAAKILKQKLKALTKAKGKKV